MNSANAKFKVKPPLCVFYMCMSMVLLFLGMELAYVLTAPEPHPAILIIATVFLIIPFSIGGLWAKRYYIKVNGALISLQKSYRVKPVYFDVSEITRVVYRVTDTRMGQTINIIVYTSGYGKFSVEMLMINFDKMKKYLEEYAGHKIQAVHKKIGV